MKTQNLLKLITLLLILTFLGCSSDESTSEITDPVTDTNVMSGNYVGTWNSSTATATFTSVAVSARLNYSGSDRLVGDFFVSPNFTVCCSAGDNDGTLILDLDGNTITSFYYNDVIIDCSGIFNGSGEIRASDQALLINFTGSDCDGDHIGQMVLIKQF